MDVRAWCDNDKLCHVAHGVHEVEIAIGIRNVAGAPQINVYNGEGCIQGPRMH